MRKLILLTIMAVLCFCHTADAAMTYGASNYLENMTFIASGDKELDPIYLFINEVETTIDGTSGVTSIILTPGTAPSSPSEGQLYYDSSSDGLLLYTGSSFVTIDTAGASSLDTAYNTGATIDVDGDAVTLTVSDGDNNRVFDVVQNDVTYNPAAMLITNAGTGTGLTFATTGTYDARGTSNLWSLTAAGAVVGTALQAGNGDMTFTEPTTNDVYLLADADAQLTIGGTSKEDINLNFATSNVLTLSSGTGTTKIEYGAVDDANGVGNIYFDSAASQVTLAANEAADDLTVQVTGAVDASLDLRSAGTGADAVKVYATAGGIDLDAVGTTMTMTNTADGSDDDFTISVAGAHDSSLILSSAGTGGDAVSILTSAASGDVKIYSADEMDIDAVDHITVGISGAAADFKVDSSAGSVYLDGGEAAADAIKMDASATAGGIDIDAGTGGITLDSDGVFSIDGAAASNVSVASGDTDENLTLSVTGATASSLIGSSAGTGDDAIDLNATAGGLDVDTVKSIVLTSTENTADSIVLQSTLGGIDILCDAASATEDIDIANTGGSVNINSSEAADLAVYLSTSNAAGQIAINSSDATADGIEIDSAGGIEIDAAGTGDDIRIDAAAASVYIEGAEADSQAIQIDASNAAGGMDLDCGSGGFNLLATAGDVTITNTDAKDINIDAQAGQVLITGSQSVADAVKIVADGANGEINLAAKVGGIDIDAASGPITIDAAGAAGDLITVTNTTGTGVSLTTAETAAIQLHTPAGGIGLSAGIAAKDAIRIESSGASGAITIQNIAGTAASAATESDASIQLYSQVGGIGLLSGLNADDSIRIETNGGDDENITIRSNQGTGQDSIYLLSDEGGIELATSAHTGASAATEHDAAIELHATGGGIGLLSTLNADDSIRLETNGGDNENITIRANQGTGTDSIYLLSDVGGIQLESTGLASDSAITLTSTAGGITGKVANGMNLTMGNTDGDAYFIVAAHGTAGSEDVRILNTNGTDEAAIEMTATAGGIKATFNDAKDLNFEGGQFLFTANHVTGDTIKFHADAGADQTIVALNDEGTGEGAITLTSTAGGVDIDAATGKDVHISGGQVTIASKTAEAGAISLTTNIGAAETILVTNTAGTGAAAINVTATAGGITVDAKDDLVITNNTNAAADDLKIVVDGDTNSSIILDSDGSASDAILLQATHATTGGITSTFKAGDFTVTGSGASADIVMDCDLFSIDGTGTSNISITANAVGEDFTVKQDGSVDASLLLMSDGTSTTDAVIIDAIAGGMDIDAKESITVDIIGGTAADADIILTNTPGTDEAAISLAATAGGIKIAANAAKDVDIDGGQINIKSAHAVTNGIVIDADGDATGTALQISTTDGAILLDADGATYGDILMETVDDVQMTIGGHFRIVDDDLMAFGTGDDVTLNYDEDGDDDLQVTGPVSFQTTLCEFNQMPMFSAWQPAATGQVWGGAATGNAGDENLMMFPEASFIYHILGNNTAELGPQFVAGGFDISFEDAADEGVEIIQGEHLVGGTKTNFTIGTDAFYLKVKLKLTDADGSDDLFIGFRKVEAFEPAVNDYDSYAMIGVQVADFFTETEGNDGGGSALVSTDLTTTNWADGESHELGIYIAANKAVTYTVDGAAAGGAVGFSWADTDVVVPFLFFLHHTEISELTYLQSWECGLQ